MVAVVVVVVNMYQVYYIFYTWYVYIFKQWYNSIYICDMIQVVCTTCLAQQKSTLETLHDTFVPRIFPEFSPREIGVTK